MADSFGLNLVVNFNNDGEPPVRWLNVAGYYIEFKSGVTTSWLCAQILRKCLQSVLFPSNIKLYFCPFSGLSLVYLKDNLLKVLRLLFGTPFTFTNLCSCLSPLGTAWPSFSRQTRLSSLQSHTFLTSRCFSAHFAEGSFVNGCKANASCSTAELFPYLCGSFWSLQKWTV